MGPLQIIETPHTIGHVPWSAPGRLLDLPRRAPDRWDPAPACRETRHPPRGTRPRLASAAGAVGPLCGT